MLIKSLIFAILVPMLQAKSSSTAAVPFDIMVQSGCPVQLSGEFTATPDPLHQGRYSYNTTLSETNVSNKSIVLIAIKGHIVEGRLFTHSDDYIYATELFAPGNSRTFDSGNEPPGDTLPGEQAKSEPRENMPTAYVAFVQFGDGSTWGDSTLGKALLRDRHLQWDRLRAFEQIYHANGEAKLIAEIEASSGQPASILKAEYEKSNRNAAALANKLLDMVKRGASRLELMRDDRSY
jgi:hypothetical protein